MTPLDIPELAFVRTLNVPKLRKLLGREARTCTWCGKSLAGTRRIRWCSNDCVHEYKQRWDAGAIRSMTYHRDKGVCAACGIDCEQWKKIYFKFKHGWAWKNPRALVEWYKPDDSHQGMNAYRTNKRGRKNIRRCEQYFRNRARIKEAMSWEADHIIPVIRGGAMLGIGNIRTLCQRCHKAETKRLAGERSAERKTLAIPESPKDIEPSRQLMLIE